MGYPNKRPLADKYLTVTMADLSTASSALVVAPAQGLLVGWRMARSATTTGTSAITVEIDGVAIADAAASAAAGGVTDVVSVDCTPTAVQDGTIIEFITDGGSTNTSIATFTAIIREL